jgi:hypothetical protein
MLSLEKVRPILEHQMNRRQLPGLIFLVGAGLAVLKSAPAQTIIENPATPLAKNAGRALKLREVWRITDEGGAFYFKSPHNLQTAEDGSLFIADQEQILRFDKDGKFLKNIFKKGQGPGEISNSFTYLIDNNELYVTDYGQRRIFRMDSDGRYIDQLSLEIGSLNLFGVRSDGYVMMKPVWPSREEQTGKLLPLLDKIKIISKDGKSEKDLDTFRTRWFMTPRVSTQWDPHIAVMSDDGRYLYGCHSTEYLIEVLDLDTGRIVKSFRRSYPRVKHVASKRQEEFRKTYGSPEQVYEWDISDLFADQNKLWVRTSTEDSAKGVLFDVFDENGRFIDSFYVGAGRSLLKVQGDVIFVIEKEKDDSLRVVKYKIME